VEASKKIIQDIKWKEVNKDIADALTEVEKLDLQKMYKQQIASADFKELENKLRNSYSQLNWDNINARTQNALTEIKIDSLKTVYTIALNNILTAKAQLKEEGMKGIPDSEITLSELEASKLNVDNSLNKLKALKEKKIIRL
jgi:type V secretory pathway adhesin AidA